MWTETEILAYKIEKRCEALEAAIESEAARPGKARGWIGFGFYEGCSELETLEYSPLCLLLEEEGLSLKQAKAAEQKRLKTLHHLRASTSTRQARPRLKAFRAATAALLG